MRPVCSQEMPLGVGGWEKVMSGLGRKFGEEDLWDPWQWEGGKGSYSGWCVGRAGDQAEGLDLSSEGEVEFCI